MTLFDYDWASANDEIGRGARCALRPCLRVHLACLRVQQLVQNSGMRLRLLPGQHKRCNACLPLFTMHHLCSVREDSGPAAGADPGPLAGCGLRECARLLSMPHRSWCPSCRWRWLWAVARPQYGIARQGMAWHGMAWHGMPPPHLSSFPCPHGAGERELADAKGDMKKRDRALVAAAKPLRGGSTKKCQLHIRVGGKRAGCKTCTGSAEGCHAGVHDPRLCCLLACIPLGASIHGMHPVRLQATYCTFTDAEEKLIVRGQRQGMAAVLDSQEVRQGPARGSLGLHGLARAALAPCVHGALCPIRSALLGCSFPASAAHTLAHHPCPPAPLAGSSAGPRHQPQPAPPAAERHGGGARGARRGAAPLLPLRPPLSVRLQPCWWHCGASCGQPKLLSSACRLAPSPLPCDMPCAQRAQPRLPPSCSCMHGNHRGASLSCPSPARAWCGRAARRSSSRQPRHPSAAASRCAAAAAAVAAAPAAAGHKCRHAGQHVAAFACPYTRLSNAHPPGPCLPACPAPPRSLTSRWRWRWVRS